MTAGVRDDPKMFKRLMDPVLAGRIGEVEDIAHTVLFLASPGGSFINGSVVPVDGGQVALGEWPDFTGRYYRKEI